jgi:hypothetical protein
MSNTDPTAWFNRLVETYGRIKFPRGVVGKTSHAMISVLILWAIIAFRLSSNSWSDPLLAVGLIATAVFIWWTRSTQGFAERNPGQAMLDGAEFLDYYKSEVLAKGLRPSTDSPLITDPEKPPPPLITDDRADQ